MDSDAEVKPEPDILAAGTSNCPPRDTMGTGYSLNVDVSADDALNLEGANNTAYAENQNFTRYGNILPEWLTPPDFDFLPAGAEESVRFVLSSITSWGMATGVLPIFNYIITAFVLAFLSRNEGKRLRYLMDQEDNFKHADIKDFNLDDKTFFLCCWPSAMVKILSDEVKTKG